MAAAGRWQIVTTGTARRLRERRGVGRQSAVRSEPVANRGGPRYGRRCAAVVPIACRLLPVACRLSPFACRLHYAPQDARRRLGTDRSRDGRRRDRLRSPGAPLRGQAAGVRHADRERAGRGAGSRPGGLHPRVAEPRSVRQPVPFLDLAVPHRPQPRHRPPAPPPPAGDLARARRGRRGRRDADRPGRRGPLGDLANRELAEALHREIAKLPPSYRELVVLRHLVGLAYNEIADLKGLPLGTVKNKLFRAHSVLREALGEYLGQVGGQP